MLHLCGYQMPFIEDYVGIGLDGLQLFQPTAGNDLSDAMNRFGDRLTFITGIDILGGESCDPADLSEGIRAAARVGSRGRFILGTTHMMQYTMPEAGYRAIFDTVRSLQHDTVEVRP